MKKRIFKSATIESIDFNKIEHESFLTQWFMSYCILVSSAERFIVKSCSQGMRQSTNQVLNNNLKVCFFQEIQHAESHEIFNELYFHQNKLIQIFSNFSSFINYKVIAAFAPLSLKISIASAMEQLNAEIAYYGLSHIRDLTSNPEFSDILVWHFVEEIEHRDYVFDLMKELKINFMIQKIGMILVLFSFSFWITAGALIINSRTGFRKFELFQLFSTDHLLERFYKSSKKYLTKNYHPSHEQVPFAFYNYQRKFKDLQ